MFLFVFAGMFKVWFARCYKVCSLVCALGKRFSITLTFKSLASSIFQLFSCGFLNQRFLIRIVRCTRKGKNWKALMGWYVRNVCIWDQHIVLWQFFNNYGNMITIGNSSLSPSSREEGCGYCGDGGFMWNSQVGF